MEIARVISRGNPEVIQEVTALLAGSKDRQTCWLGLLEALLRGNYVVEMDRKAGTGEALGKLQKAAGRCSRFEVVMGALASLDDSEGRENPDGVAPFLREVAGLLAEKNIVLGEFCVDGGSYALFLTRPQHKQRLMELARWASRRIRFEECGQAAFQLAAQGKQEATLRNKTTRFTPALLCLLAVLVLASVVGWFGYLILLPVFLVVALFAIFAPFPWQNEEMKFNADDIFAIAGCMAFFTVMAVLHRIGMTRDDITFVVLLFVAVFAAYMLFRAFMKGKRKRKVYAEADCEKPQ